MWKLVSDWQQRLNSSYTLVEGSPFYIDHVNIHGGEEGCCTIDDIRLLGYFLETRDEDFVCINMADNPDVDFNYNPMGYANFEGDCFYIRRKPSRYYKYTATKRSLAPTSGMGRRALEQCLLKIQENDYPSYAQAKELISEGGWRRVAFSRDFAIAYNGRLLYKGMEAGRYSRHGGITLLDNFKQLKEKLEVGDEIVR